MPGLTNEMTYYFTQLFKINKSVYSNDCLSNKVIAAKHFIDTHFAENITINSISRKVYISKFHLIRSFRLYYGITPYQHLTIVRLNQAKKMLQANISPIETCFAVGFTSIPSFTTLFRKKTGLPPAIYQQLHTKKAIPDKPFLK